MENKKLKNMIFLKDLPSNVIEEAIVILKPNAKIKANDYIESKNGIKKFNAKESYNSQNYMVKEAEMVINNYISRLERTKKESYKTNKKIINKCKKLRILSIVLGIMLTISFCTK